MVSVYPLKLNAAFLPLAWRRRDLSSARQGTAAVEFAIVGPLLLLVLAGIFTYGGYFLTAHTLQQATNDAARAAIAGLDDDERLTIARTSVQTSLADQPFMRGDIRSVTLRRDGTMMTVQVSYDASDDVYSVFAALLPAPSSQISRTATIRMGGY